MFTETVQTIAGSTNDAWVDDIGLAASFSNPFSVMIAANSQSLLVGEAAGRVRAVRLSDCMLPCYRTIFGLCLHVVAFLEL